MYLHIGNNITVREEEIIGIFDMDNTTVSKKSRDFLNKASKENRLFFEGYDLPKSFLVCAEKKGDNRVFLSILNSSTLQKRIGKNEL